MNKNIYTAPAIHVLHMAIQDNIAQFVVASEAIGENAGEAKKVVYSEEDFEENESSWW